MPAEAYVFPNSDKDINSDLSFKLSSRSLSNYRKPKFSPLKKKEIEW